MGDWPIYFVAGDRGSDGATGLDSNSPLKTLKKALEKVHAWGGAATIELRDCLVPGAVIAEGGVTLRGQGAAWGGGSSKVQATSGATGGINPITVAAPDFRAERITTVGPEDRWTGVGWRLRDGSQNATLRDCWHVGHPRTICDDRSGGTALMVSDAEGHYIENFRFARCRRGVRQGHESSGLHIVNLKGSQASCEALVIDGEPTGGIKVVGWKTTHCASHNGGLAASLGPNYGPAGNGVFIGFDCEEASWPAHVDIYSWSNTFIGGCSAPGTRFYVHGNLNGFDGFKINGEAMIAFGRGNTFDRVHNAGPLVIDNPDNVVGTVANESDHMLVLAPGVRRR